MIYFFIFACCFWVNKYVCKDSGTLSAGRDPTAADLSTELWPIWRLLLDHGGEIGEKIVLQDRADTREQLRIEALLAEDAVDVRTVASQMAGKPADPALLPLQLREDRLANVYAFHIPTASEAVMLTPAPGVDGFVVGQKESVEPFYT